MSEITVHMDLGKMQQLVADNPTIVLNQEMDHWCWAGAIEILFACHGYAFPEKVLVHHLFGELKNAGATIQQIVSILNHDFEDIHGKAFQSRAKNLRDVSGNPYDVIIYSLSRRWPLLVGNKNHAMLLVGVQYTTEKRR